MLKSKTKWGKILYSDLLQSEGEDQNFKRNEYILRSINCQLFFDIFPYWINLKLFEKLEAISALATLYNLASFLLGKWRRRSYKNFLLFNILPPCLIY